MSARPEHADPILWDYSFTVIIGDNRKRHPVAHIWEDVDWDSPPNWAADITRCGARISRGHGTGARGRHAAHFARACKRCWPQGGDR